ncbi:MAG: three component ABC system middle component [Treponema sp.]|nr:three component ABC system middle component [Treponema sp.]
MVNSEYNNLGIGIISIMSVLNKLEVLAIEKVFLILPIITNSELLSYLGRKDVEMMGIEQLIPHKIKCFVNFNKRFYDNLSLCINSLQYLFDMKYISINGSLIMKNKDLPFDKKMGKRAERIYNASERISKLLKENSNKLYLNLKVEL